MENPEIIQLNTNAEGKLVATLAYRDPQNGLPINDFNTIREVPVNLRPLQLSSRGNVLVDQSVKNDLVAVATPVDRTRSTGANNAYGFDDSIKP